MSHLHQRTIFSTATFIAVLLGLTLLPCGHVSAKTKVETEPKDQKMVVDSVNSSEQSITVTDTDKKTTTYKIGDFTQITVLGQKATFSDIKAGQEVLSFVEGGSSSLDSLALGASIAAAPSEKAAKTKKPKPVKATIN